jgi:hypothetical protein
MPDINPSIASNAGDFLLYQTEDGGTRLEVRMGAETVWLSLNQLAELFQRDKSVISKHIRNIFQEGELNPSATVAKFATVQKEGGREVSRDRVVAKYATTTAEGEIYQVEFFSLYAIESESKQSKEEMIEV